MKVFRGTLSYILLLILFFSVFGPLYQLFAGTFFIVKESIVAWGLAASFTLSVILLIITLYLLKTASPLEKTRHDIYMKKQGKIFSLFYIPLLLGFITIFSYSALLEATASILTGFLGNPYKSIIIVENENDIERGGKLCAGRYEISSPQFEHNTYFNKFCIHRDNKERLQFPGIIHVEGKESLAGKTVEFYEVETRSYSLEEFQKLKLEAEKFWH